MRAYPTLLATLAAFAFASVALPGTASVLRGPAIAIVPHADGVHDLGRANAAAPIDVTLSLGYQHASELDALIEAQSDPASPQFRHFLSNAQFNAYFAPSAQTYERVALALRRAGFTIVTTYENRTLIEATAPARTVEKYFDTEIHAVRQDGQGAAYANVRPATLPSELVGAVDTVVGLDNLMKARFDYQFGPRSSALPDTIGGPLHGPDSGYGPLAVAQGFDFPVQHGKDGTGHAVANVAGDVLTTDADAFFKEFGITRTGKLLRTVIQSPSGPANVEAALDLETMGSLAPGADVHLYILSDPIDSVGEKAYNQIVTDNSVDAVNSSFGVCETGDPSYAMAALAIIKQGEAKGISWSASTGDSGANGCGGPQQVPAALPNVLGVGGTHIVVDPKGNYVSESAWSGGGGGVSSLFKIPKYQKGVKGLASTTNRNLPDIAFPADVQDSFYYQGAWQGPIGGTSWASPISVALRAEVNQIENSRAGFANPLPYGIFKSTAYRAFHDITTGSNGFPAKKGYDNATGIGSVRGFTYAGLE